MQMHTKTENYNQVGNDKMEIFKKWRRKTNWKKNKELEEEKKTIDNDMIGYDMIWCHGTSNTKYQRSWSKTEEMNEENCENENENNRSSKRHIKMTLILKQERRRGR